MVFITQKNKSDPALEGDVFGIARLFSLEEEDDSVEVEIDRLSYLVVQEGSSKQTIPLSVGVLDESDDESEDELIRQLLTPESSALDSPQESSEQEPEGPHADEEEKKEDRMESPQSPHLQMEDEEPEGLEEELDQSSLFSNVLAVTQIKSTKDPVSSIYHIYLFATTLEKPNELKSAQETVERCFDSVVDHIPFQDRDSHFKAVDLWQRVPSKLNEKYKTDLMDLDSARIYELLAVSSNLVYPTSSQGTYSCTCNLSFLCAPASGIVAGFKMFTDLTFPNIELKWFAYTKHALCERDHLEEVVLNDSALFWEASKWKLVLNNKVNITTKEEADEIVEIIRADFPAKLDILVADLSVGKIQSTVTYETFDAQLQSALLNEAAQISIALRTLKDGGTLILSVVNPIEPKTTIGNLRLLAGLFQNLSIVPTRPSSTWVRPTMIVCSGFVGCEAVERLYPDLEETYLSYIDKTLKCDKKVVLNFSSFPRATREKLKTLADYFALEGRIRTQRFVMTFLEGFEDQGENQEETTKDWFDLLDEHVANVRDHWGVFKSVPQIASPESLQELKVRMKKEYPVNEENADETISRLCQTYAGPREPPAPLNAIAYYVIIEESANAKVEGTPKTILFTRFAPLELMYDRLVTIDIAKQIRRKLPRNKSQESCKRHAEVDVLKALLQLGFNVDKKRLIVACASLSVSRRLDVVEAGVYLHVLSVLYGKLKDLIRDDCLYVCQFPLWTRFLIGVFCIAKACFEETRIIISDNFAGVLFLKYRGFNNADAKSAIHRIRKIKQCLDLRMSMEVVPLNSIMGCMDMGALIKYNAHLIRNEVCSIVNILDFLFNQEEQV